MSDSAIRTLLVTKDDGVANQLDGLLKQATGAFNVTRHESAKDAAAACKSTAPDCILYDQSGTGEDGAAFIQMLESQCGHIPAPIIVLLAEEKKPVLAKLIKAGVADYLVLKDLPPDTVSRTMRAALERHVLETRLHQQRNLFKAVLGGSPGLIAIKNASLEYQAVNPVFCAFLGKSQEDVVGKTDDAVFAKKDAEIYKKDDLNVLKNGIPQSKRIEMIGAEGARVLEVVRTPIIDSAGEISGVFFAGHDITAARDLEAQLQALHSTLDSVSLDQQEMVCRIAPKGVLSYVNRAVCAAFGKKHEQLHGQGFSTLIPKDAQTEVRNLLASLKPESPSGVHRQKITVNGEERWQEWTTRAIYNEGGKLEEFISVGRDVTALVGAEHATQEVRGELEAAKASLAEIGEARKAAEDAAQAHKAAMEEKDAALARVNDERDALAKSVGGLEHQVREKDQALGGLQDRLGQAEGQLHEAHEKLQQHDQAFREKDEAIARAQQEASAREGALRDRETAFNDLERRFQEMEQLLKANEGELAERETQVKQAREQAEHLRGELDHLSNKLHDLLTLIPTAVFELAAGTKITFMSPAASEILGCDPQEADGGALTLLDFFDAKDKKGATECMKESMQHRTRTSGEFRIVRRDGSSQEVFLTAAPVVRDDKIQGMQVALTDISAGKEAGKMLETVRRLADTAAATAGMLTGVARITSGLVQNEGVDLDPRKLEAFEKATDSARGLLEELLTQRPGQ